MLELYDLSVEYKTSPVGLDDVQPRFSWKLRTEKQDTHQITYRLQVRCEAVCWDTGRVESDQSILIPYAGPALAPRTEYRWEVTVWTDQGEEATAASGFETGLLSGSAFQGRAKV